MREPGFAPVSLGLQSPRVISSSTPLSSNKVGRKHTRQQENKDEISWDGVIGRRRLGPHGWDERLGMVEAGGRANSAWALWPSWLQNQFQFAPGGAVMVEGRAFGSSPPVKNTFQGTFVDCQDSSQDQNSNTLDSQVQRNSQLPVCWGGQMSIQAGEGLLSQGIFLSENPESCYW